MTIAGVACGDGGVDHGAMAADLSICIVNWNGKAMLLDLLASIGRQGEGLAIQTIVVDNGSADGSVGAVAGAFGEVEVIANSCNAGFGVANNQAAHRARGRYLLLLNNDTLVRAGALRTLVGFLDGHPNAVAAAPRLVGADGRTQQTVRALPTFGALLDRLLILKWTRLNRRAYREYRDGEFDPDRPAAVAQVAAAALMIRREAFEAVGGFDEGFVFGVEDVDLCARLARLGEIHYRPEVAIDHLGRVGSRANRAFVYTAYECGYARYLRKHDRRGWAVWIYKLLVTLDVPVRVALLAGSTVVNRLRGRRERAGEYGARLAAATGFLMTGMGRFWRE